MSCNTCKSKPKQPTLETKSESKNYFSKVIVFVITTVIFIPFIIPIFIWALFNVIVLSKGVDITPLLKYLGRKIFKEEEEVDTVNEELNEDEYELENPNDIIVYKSK